MHEITTRSAASVQERLFALELFEGKTNGKARRRRTTHDLAGGVRRQIRAIATRLADEDADQLRVLLGLEQELHRAWVVAVAGVRQHASTNGGRPSTNGNGHEGGAR